MFHEGAYQFLEGEGDEQSLSPFGLAVITEMNRLGIACDISHLSWQKGKIPRKVIEASNAPVIISHANAAGIVSDSFNVDDETLDLLMAKGGIVCLTFFSEYVSPECNAVKDSIKEPKNKPRTKVKELVDHIDYLKARVGIEFIGIGSDYGGNGRKAPQELKTAEGFPQIIFHMLKRGYSESEIAAVIGGNFLKFLIGVEADSYPLITLNSSFELQAIDGIGPRGPECLKRDSHKRYPDAEQGGNQENHNSHIHPVGKSLQPPVDENP